jgi:hypothetical protein
VKKFVLIAFAVLGFVGSAGCGRLDITLDFVNFYVKSEVDDMFDLKTPQKIIFKKDYAAQLEKIKREQFPLYANYLEKIATAYESNSMNSEKASQFFDDGVKIFFSTPPLWRDAVMEVVETLTPEQFDSFEGYFNKKVRKEKDHYKAKDDREKQQLKLMNKWIDESIEDLSSGQEKKLKAYIKTNPKPYELLIKSQEDLFRQFKEAFPDKEKRKEFISQFLIDWKKLQLPEYVKAHEIYLEKLKDYVIDLSLNLSDRQKKDLLSNLHRRIKELRKISQNP